MSDEALGNLPSARAYVLGQKGTKQDVSFVGIEDTIGVLLERVGRGRTPTAGRSGACRSRRSTGSRPVPTRPKATSSACRTRRRRPKRLCSRAARPRARARIRDRRRLARPPRLSREDRRHHARRGQWDRRHLHRSPRRDQRRCRRGHRPRGHHASLRARRTPGLLGRRHERDPFAHGLPAEDRAQRRASPSAATASRAATRRAASAPQAIPSTPTASSSPRASCGCRTARARTQTSAFSSSSPARSTSR